MRPGYGNPLFNLTLGDRHHLEGHLPGSGREVLSDQSLLTPEVQILEGSTPGDVEVGIPIENIDLRSGRFISKVECIAHFVEVLGFCLVSNRVNIFQLVIAVQRLDLEDDCIAHRVGER